MSGEFEKLFSAAITDPSDVGQYVESVVFGDPVPEAVPGEFEVTEPGTDPSIDFVERVSSPLGAEDRIQDLD